jgi:hypothetical protein
LSSGAPRRSSCDIAVNTAKTAAPKTLFSQARSPARPVKHPVLKNKDEIDRATRGACTGKARKKENPAGNDAGLSLSYCLKKFCYFFARSSSISFRTLSISAWFQRLFLSV